MIAIYQGRSLLSRYIRWRTWSDYSHAAYVFPDWSVVEAWRKGVTHSPNVLSYHHPETVVHLYMVDMTADQLWLVQDFLLSQVGKGYDWSGLFGFTVRAPFQSPERWFCSELIFAAFLHAGIKLLANVDSWMVTPGMLATSPRLTFYGPYFREAEFPRKRGNAKTH